MSSAMEVLAWNCCGMNNEGVVQALRLLIQKHQPGIIFLCETKVSDWEYMRDLRLKLGYLNCEAVWSTSRDGGAVQSGGLAMFRKNDIHFEFKTKSRNHIDVEVWSGGMTGARWRLTGFYGNPVTAERYRFWPLLKTLADESSIPWVVIEDCNELVSLTEKTGTGFRPESQMQAFRDTLSYCELGDLGFHGSQFMWKGRGIRERLDRAVGTLTWTDLFPAARVKVLDPIHGDHV